MPSYSISRDGTAGLALPTALDQRLGEALRSPAGAEIAASINDAINHALNTQGGWDGNWNAETIVRDILDTATCDLVSGERAQYILDTLHTQDVAVGSSRNGSIATLTPQALATLAALTEECDGHYDGAMIWIGGYGYDVVSSAAPVAG